jgi:hypothetical protein
MTRTPTAGPWPATSITPSDENFFTTAAFVLPASIDLPHSPAQIWEAITDERLGARMGSSPAPAGLLTSSCSETASAPRLTPFPQKNAMSSSAGSDASPISSSGPPRIRLLPPWSPSAKRYRVDLVVPHEFRDTHELRLEQRPHPRRGRRNRDPNDAIRRLSSSGHRRGGGGRSRERPRARKRTALPVAPRTALAGREERPLA